MNGKGIHVEQRSLFDPAPVKLDGPAGPETSRTNAEAECAAGGTSAGTTHGRDVAAAAPVGGALGKFSLFAEDDPFVAPPPARIGPAPSPVGAKSAPPARVLPSRENEWSGIEDMEALKPRVLGCSACQLRDGARGVVFGEGDPHSAIMFVGEGPGQTEDEIGRPFVGRAGQLLDLMLKTVGFEREQVFIANIVKCRPPGNRLPLPPEVAVCLPNLTAQIRIVNPKMIVLLGALSSQTLIDPAIRVTRDRGKWFEKDGRSHLVTFHPAAVLRDEQGKRGLLLDDFRSLRAKWERLQDVKPQHTD